MISYLLGNSITHSHSNSTYISVQDAINLNDLAQKNKHETMLQLAISCLHFLGVCSLGN